MSVTQYPSPTSPLLNLSLLYHRVNSLRHFLSNSLLHNSPISTSHLHLISSHISSSIPLIISNASSLITTPTTTTDQVVEIPASHLMADHTHFCPVCGKGFKRDANLRMHMRAHGNRYKTMQALSKPGSRILPNACISFSCPVIGCGRNRQHERFRPLKSAACVKNHYRRSHCAKVYACGRCKERRFAVVGDLRSHLRRCGERRWECCCGTRFSRKDKLVGHLALFEGHSPVVVEGGGGGGEGLDPEFFDGLMDEIGEIGGV